MKGPPTLQTTPPSRSPLLSSGNGGLREGDAPGHSVVPSYVQGSAASPVAVGVPEEIVPDRRTRQTG